jgi:hypothetical protein
VWTFAEDLTLSQTIAPAAINLGFLTVLREANGYLGGYLVTNQWGRPLEFRLSTAVQPNRVQQVLYAGTLEAYLCADLIGKTLVEKTGVPVQLILTDTKAVLDLRNRLEVPVLWLAPSASADQLVGSEAPATATTTEVGPAPANRGTLHCHARFPDDAVRIRDLLERVSGAVDPAEPFARIREAIGEARKMGVTTRSAA